MLPVMQRIWAEARARIHVLQSLHHFDELLSAGDQNLGQTYIFQAP